MKKTISILLSALMLVMGTALPLAGLAEEETTREEGLGNSATIHSELSADKLGHLILTINNVDVDLKAIDEGSDVTPYAELDATVIGINSADVAYDMTVSETADGLEINAHHTGSDIGINRVKLHVYVPADAVKTLTLALADSYLVVDQLNLEAIDGDIAGGDLDGRTSNVQGLSVKTTDTRINYAGDLDKVDLDMTGGSAKLNTGIVPSAVRINATDADVEVIVPETDEGFTLTYDVVEGSMATNFVEEYEESGAYTVGGGGATFDIAVTNGKLTVNRK